MVYRMKLDKLFDTGSLWRVEVITVWDKKDENEQRHFFSFSGEEKTGLLYFKNLKKCESVIFPEELFRFKYIAGKNIKCVNQAKNKFCIHLTDIRKTGSALFLMTSLSKKEPIHPPFRDGFIEENELREYLKESNDADFLSPSVQEASRKISEDFSSGRNRYPYGKACLIFSWIRKNISYSILPKHAVERMEKTIRSLPANKRSVYMILQSTFAELPPSELMKVARQIKIPPEVQEPADQVRYIAKRFGPLWTLFFYTWEGKKTRSASRTIADKMGKCDCFSNVFVALCRSMGIPAMVVTGYFRDEGHHAWAAAYIPPYGWIETDPTNDNSFHRFKNKDYSYEFLKTDFEGEKYIFPIKDTRKKDWLQKCRTFYKKSEHHPTIEEISAVISAE